MIPGSYHIFDRWQLLTHCGAMATLMLDTPDAHVSLGLAHFIALSYIVQLLHFNCLDPTLINVSISGNAEHCLATFVKLILQNGTHRWLPG